MSDVTWPLGDYFSASPIYSRIRKHSFFRTELTSRLVLSNRYIMQPTSLSYTGIKKEKETGEINFNNIFYFTQYIQNFIIFACN